MEKITDRVDYYDKKIFGAINKYWAKAVKLLRAKEFLAEFLGTFVLVVSKLINLHFHVFVAKKIIITLKYVLGCYS